MPSPCERATFTNMKTHLTTITLALCLGYLGGYLGGKSSQPKHNNEATLPAVNSSDLSDYIVSENEYNPTETIKLEELQYKVEKLELQLEALAQSSSNNESENENHSNSTTNASFFGRPAKPNLKSLSATGMSTDEADKLLRRMSQQEYQRLELQNNIRRNQGAASNTYREQLRELNQNKISLRSELGDEDYDKYLFASQQSNRVKISSVMAGSPAESSGFESNDIILSYDDQKILNWADIRRVTLEGDIGSYTNVNILRDGERMSLMVPRGTLGVQLEPVQLDPDE